MRCILILMLLALAGCGSATPNAPVAVQSAQVSSYTVPQSPTPIYAVEVWITGTASDVITLPSNDGRDLAYCNFYPEYGAWKVAAITITRPFNGCQLFTITPGEHNVFALTAIAWDGSPVGF